MIQATFVRGATTTIASRKGTQLTMNQKPAQKPEPKKLAVKPIKVTTNVRAGARAL
jgi:hypothetical protein